MPKTWTKAIDSRSNWVSRVESKLFETKPFQSIIKGCSGLMSLAGIKNRESRHNNRESSVYSRLDSWFSILARMENRVSTYFWTVLYKAEVSSCTARPMLARSCLLLNFHSLIIVNYSQEIWVSCRKYLQTILYNIQVTLYLKKWFWDSYFFSRIAYSLKLFDIRFSDIQN